MSDADQLYQDVLLDHHRCPRNQRSIRDATVRSKGFNPKCGDEVEVFLSIRGNVITDASFQGQSCAICTASASILTGKLPGMTVEQTQHLVSRVGGRLGKGEDLVECHNDPMDSELEALGAIRKYPGRIQCAWLPWDALTSALSDRPV